MIINKELTLETDNGSTIILEMDRIQRIEKDQLSTITSYEEEPNYNSNDTSTAWEEVDTSPVINKKKKRKGKFWKVLGDLAVATINKTAENIKNQPLDENQDQEYYEIEEYENSDDIIENEYESTFSSTAESTGSICFINPNLYARKIILANRNSTKEETITVGKSNYGKANNSCLYDIPTGIYTCKIYTVFSKKMIAQFSIRISEGEEISKNLTKNHYN